jgi:F0F1-type ATP synthase delta subunit
VLRLSKDSQGTHVIQKVLSCFEEQKRAFIFEEVFDDFIELAKNNNGLCVIKKLV